MTSRSNINRQFVLAAGVGVTWSKTDRLTFRTAYGTTTTRFESELTMDGSFATGDDIRADALNSITVAISSNVALKSSIRVLFRNLPALESLDLRSPSGLTIMVEVPKERIDTNLTTSLVITF